LNATGSVKATTGMTALMMVLQFCATISNVATSSRQLYAFARDDGLPYSKFLCHVSRKHFGSFSFQNIEFQNRLTDASWYP
jgi:amino acid transporter